VLGPIFVLLVFVKLSDPFRPLFLVTCYERLASFYTLSVCRDSNINLGAEAFTPVVFEIIIFWVLTPCIL